MPGSFCGGGEPERVKAWRGLELTRFHYDRIRHPVAQSSSCQDKENQFDQKEDGVGNGTYGNTGQRNAKR